MKISNTARDLKRLITFIDWEPEKLKHMRQYLGLTREEVAYALNVSVASVIKMENSNVGSAALFWLYGELLERCYAASKGYVKAYRKVGENSFISDIDVKRITALG